MRVGAEPFSWAFELARAYTASGEERYAEGFWALFEDWMQHNPPNGGPNWMCGQEATFRLMGATFARFVCAGAGASTPQRIEAFQRFVVATGRRIAANIDYALSQSNNHGVSECVGLITAGLLVPEHEEAAKWLRMGFSSLRRQLAELVYPDGGFAQHSAVYHRVLLHDVLWCVSMLRQTEKEVPTWLIDAGKRALDFIDALMDEVTGRVPLYGANDGANVLPLSDGHYLDFRPVVQAGHAVLHGTRRLPPGPWDEAAEWLAPEVGGQRPEVEAAQLLSVPEVETEERISEGGWRMAEASGQPPEARGAVCDPRRPTSNLRPPTSDLRPPKSDVHHAPSAHFPHAGCLLWRSGGTRLFLRCPTRFRHRPSQADMLHVSVDWRGQPIAIDAGTYSYNAPGPFAGSLKEAAVHNTVTFDGAEPLEKISRFLYLPWPEGEAGWMARSEDRGRRSEVGRRGTLIRGRSPLRSLGEAGRSEDGGQISDSTHVFRASHDGWRRLGCTHERTVRCTDGEQIEVFDLVSGRGRHTARVHWLLCDVPHAFDGAGKRLLLKTSAGEYAVTWSRGEATLVRSDPDSNRGWWSPYYFRAEPALSLAIDVEVEREVQVCTTFSPVG